MAFNQMGQMGFNQMGQMGNQQQAGGSVWPTVLMAIIIIGLVIVIIYGYLQYQQQVSNMNELAATLSIQSDDVATMLVQAQGIKANSDQYTNINAQLLSANTNLATDTAQLSQLTGSTASLQASLQQAQATVFAVDDYILTQYVGQDANLLGALRDIRNAIIAGATPELTTICNAVEVSQIASFIQQMTTTQVQNGVASQDPNGQCGNQVDIANYLVSTLAPVTSTTTQTAYWPQGGGENALRITTTTGGVVTQDTVQVSTTAADGSTSWSTYDLLQNPTAWTPGTELSSITSNTTVSGNQTVYNALVNLSMQISVLIGNIIAGVCPGGTYNAQLALNLAQNLYNAVCTSNEPQLIMGKGIDYGLGRLGYHIARQQGTLPAVSYTAPPIVLNTPTVVASSNSTTATTPTVSVTATPTVQGTFIPAS